jgi:hypothetical protein
MSMNKRRDAKKGDVPEHAIIGIATRPCAVRLTSNELLEFGERLAQVEDDIATENAQQEDTKKGMKARISALEARRTELASIVRRKHETRDVQVDLVATADDGKVREVRQDTGEVIFTRLLSDEERQKKLFPEGAPAAEAEAATT